MDDYFFKKEKQLILSDGIVIAVLLPLAEGLVDGIVSS